MGGAAGATSAVEASAKQAPRRKALQFGQGLQNGFKLAEPVQPSETPPTYLRHNEQWTDDGWDLPADLIAQQQRQSESMQLPYAGTTQNRRGIVETPTYGNTNSNMWNTVSDGARGGIR